jgi:hypothetical protein
MGRLERMSRRIRWADGLLRINLKEKEIDRGGGIWAKGEGKVIWAEKEKEKEIEDGFGTFNF